MSWTAPEVTRPEPPTVAEERPMLESWLDYQRATLQLKCAGLDGEQLARRAVEPSSLSLLGLVRHMAEVERSWFRRRLARQDLEMIYCGPDNEDGDFDDVDAASAEQDFTTYAREVDAAREVAERHSLDETFVHQRHKVEMDLRWVYVHMIEEYARHNGHADLLRERIDGVTGE
jgi:hypothetical protein